MNQSILAQENALFKGSAGLSANNRPLGFRPAFRNNENGCIYASRFADGRLAPIHMIHGLPDELVTARSATGRITSVKASVQAGFTLGDDFYDREQAASYAQALRAIDVARH